MKQVSEGVNCAVEGVFPPCAFCRNFLSAVLYDLVVDEYQYEWWHNGYSRYLVLADKVQFCFSGLTVKAYQELLRDFRLHKERVPTEWEISLEVTVVPNSSSRYMCPKCFRRLEEI